LRNELGMTQVEFARKIGMLTAQSISNIERGITEMSDRHIRKIARAFGPEIAKKIIKHKVSSYRTQLEQKAFR